MEETKRDYNTSRGPLIIKEYGRNLQKMVEYLKTIEDREKRNQSAQALINVMASMSPQSKDNTELRQKLWNHLFAMADYDLDVDCPYPKPERPNKDLKIERPAYSDKYQIRYRHYGKILEKMIDKTIEIQEPDKRNYLIKSIANQMKKAYITWNRDNVSDDVILAHLQEISGNQLQLQEGTVLANHVVPASQQGSSKKKKHKNKNKAFQNNQFQRNNNSHKNGHLNNGK